MTGGSTSGVVMGSAGGQKVPGGNPSSGVVSASPGIGAGGGAGSGVNPSGAPQSSQGGGGAECTAILKPVDLGKLDAVETTSHLVRQFLETELRLCNSLSKLEYPQPVTHIYNPVDYAFEPHSCFVKKYCNTTKHIMFMGMNPGPYGMAQTGVSHLEENGWVREWWATGESCHEECG